MLKIEPLEKRILLTTLHTPRVQPEGIIWQSDGDSYTAEIREVGGNWSNVSVNDVVVVPEDPGIDPGRVNHELYLSLNPDSSYEYRITGPTEIFQKVFETPRTTGAFTFTAYGDSAGAHNNRVLTDWNKVADLNLARNPDFTILTGDNAYNDGTFEEQDARYSPILSPGNTEFVSTKIEYAAVGNHDDVIVHEQTYMNPVVPGLVDPESSYSFDYSNARFVVINAEYHNHNPNPQQAWTDILNWATTELENSTAEWKIVVSHYPLASRAEHIHAHAGEPYYSELLALPGVDLFLVSHAHNYQRSFPLTGVDEAENALYYQPLDNNFYPKGAGAVQVINGAGGREIDRPGLPINSPVDYVAYGLIEAEGLELGVQEVEINGDTLTSRFVGVSGAILDEFTIGPGVIQTPSVPTTIPFNQTIELTVGEDTFIDSSNPDTEYSTGTGGQFSQQRNMWRWDSPTEMRHTLIKFEGIPEGVVISSAKLRYKGAGPPASLPFSNTAPADIFEMLDPWVDTSTWNDLNGAMNHGPRISQISPADYGYLELDLTESVQRIADGGPNNGWLIKAFNKDASGIMSMESSDPPSLIIEFYRPGDANGDDYANGDDANIVSSNFLLANASLSDGDFNNDGIVDGLDVNILSNNWLTGTPPAITQQLSVFDLDKDGQLGISDMELLSLRFGEVVEDGEDVWEDLNGDGIINGLDVNILSQYML